jgi:hypothetical protein
MLERGNAPVARDLGRLMQAFARTARARQLYSPNNMVLVRMLSELKRAFDEVLARQPELNLKVRSDALYFEDVPVLEESNPDDSLPFAFYRDGVRRLDFLRGLSLEELGVLVSAVARGFSYAGLGDDIVSELWQHDLEHIQYLVVDTSIVDAAGVAGQASQASEANDLDAQLQGLLLAIYGSSSDDVGPRSLHLDGSELAAKALAESIDAVDELAPGFHPPRNFVQPPAYQPTLQEQLQREGPERLAARAVNAALHALHAGASGPDQEGLLEALLRIFDAALVERDLRLATRVVAGVRSVPRPGRSLEAWLDEAVSEARLRQTAASFAATPAAEAEHLLVPFFRAAGARSVPTILAILPTVSDPAFRRALSELALELGIADLGPVRELLTNEQGYVANEALFLLSRLTSPEASALKREAEVHPRANVRIALLEMASELPPEEATEIALNLVKDPEPRVRVAAARALGRLRTRLAALGLEGLVEAVTFESEALEVRRELLKSYAVLTQARALPVLIRHLKRGEGLLANREAEDLALLAIEALTLVRQPRSIEALKKACLARSKRVREGAHAALVAMKESR